MYSTLNNCPGPSSFSMRGTQSLGRSLTTLGRILRSSEFAVGNPIGSASAPAPLVVAAASRRQLSKQASKSGGLSPATKSLVSKLSEEIKGEADYKPEEVIASGPPKGWTVDEKEGDSHVILSLSDSKSQARGETVEISLLASDDNIEAIPIDEEEGAESEEGDEDGEDTVYEVPFTVNITREGAQDGLVFDCVTDGEGFTIRKAVAERFAFPEDDLVEGAEPPTSDFEDGLDEPLEPYRGPIFENLDPELQEKFYEYLEERGVTQEVVSYLHGLVFDKEQREYTRWLGRVKAFLESK